jgi:hypothetical protein
MELRPCPVPPQSTPPPVADGQRVPIRCGSCHQHNISFKFQGSKILKTKIDATHVPGRRWSKGPSTGPLERGQGILQGTTSPPPVEDSPVVTDAVAPATSGGRETCRAPGKRATHALTAQPCTTYQKEHTSTRSGCDDRMDAPLASARGRFT